MCFRIVRTAVVLALASAISYGCVETTVPEGAGSSTPAQISISPAPSDATPSVPGVLKDSGSPTVAAAAETPASTTVALYVQPPSPSGGLLHSSLRDPDGSDTDQWAWDGFAFDTTQTITDVRWRGAYDPARGGSGGPVSDFTVDIYESIPAGIEPDISNPPLVHYEVGGNAGETPAEVLGGVQTYDYRFALPIPFEADAWTQYWIQIQALQSGAPDWGLAKGTNGDLQYFRRIPGEGYDYWLAQGDAAFELLGPSLGGNTPTPVVTKSPEEIAALIDELPPAEVVPVNEEGVQELVLVVSRSGYTPGHFSVKPGVPVRLTFRQLGYVPGGNILLIHWDSQEEIPLVLTSPADTKVLEFTPQEPGEYRFRCPHDWYEGVMTVQK